ncbi:MAG: hypothetical protein QNJ91_04660 [Gammaproteobacteria bacterium]|nr:hypothetical protein [Gammaproteobacteria bacterium]
MTDNQATPGGGLYSKVVVVVLLALAIGLYLRIVMVEAESPPTPPADQASVRVIEGDEPLPALTPAPLRDLPADQMALIEKVFTGE